jgi:hypothetical protein
MRALLDAGDHGSARDEARAVLADEAAPADECDAAAAVLASLAPERGAVIVGLAGLAIAAAVILWTVLRS